jgi:hypothetical protein
MTKADGGQQRNNQPTTGAAKAGGGGGGDGDMLHYWVYLGTYRYLPTCFDRFSHHAPTTHDSAIGSPTTVTQVELCRVANDTNSHMRVHTYEFVCDRSIIRFRTYDLVLLLFITSVVLLLFITLRSQKESHLITFRILTFQHIPANPTKSVTL